jgi:hypothetical protein
VQDKAFAKPEIEAVTQIQKAIRKRFGGKEKRGNKKLVHTAMVN